MRHVCLSLLCCLGLSAAVPAAECPARAKSLRCEYRVNPLGVDVVQPRLSWEMEDSRRGAKQTAYQILVASSPEKLARDEGDLWDSDKVLTDQSTHIVYAGKPLQSRMRCYWKVRLWDAASEATPYSEPGSWCMGLLKPEDWHAEWIRFGRNEPPSSADASRSARDIAISPWMRKTFELGAKPERGLAYVNALGYYELYVNGRKIGGDVLSPALSDYRARSFYVTYDITPYLRQGHNCVGLWLGRGWVAERFGVQSPGPVVRFQGEISVGGNIVQIMTDRTWKCTRSPYATLGPWAWNNFGGERFDARLDDTAWCTVDYDDRRWDGASIATPPPSRSEAQACPLNRIGRRIPVATRTDLGSGRYELDFGTNVAGWLRMRLPALTAGHRVVIHYADQRYATAVPEQMPPGVDRHGSDETFETARGKVRYQTFHQADEFISAGRSREMFCSKFNYHGFRYAIVDGLPKGSSVDDAEALLIESDLESVGSFACSNELLNRIGQLNLWTIRCLNLGGYMVDCPHRERMGFGGDGQVSAETCLMNFWMPNFYAKWLGDWRDVQNRETGSLPNTAPLYDSDPTGENAPAWGGGFLALAWRTYLYYGDRRLLEKHYTPMRRYVERLERRCDNDILRVGRDKSPWFLLGDWLPPDRGMDTNNWPPPRAKELFNNCYRVYLWQLLEKAALSLGREDDARQCRAQLDRIRPLVHREFYEPDKHYYVSDDQAYQCLPLLTGITPASQRTNVLRQLEQNIVVRRNNHLDTGMHGTYFLIQYLSAIQRDDLLFAIVNQRTYPGWGYMLERGATTMWEQWNGYYSQIHACFTSIDGWFYNSLGGIQPDPDSPGFKHFFIRPAVVGDLAWVKCSYRSIHGTIVANWTRRNGRLTLELTVPPNTTATVYLPAKDDDSVMESGQTASKAEGVKRLPAESGRAVFAVDSGRYVFSAAFSLPAEDKGKR